MKLTEITQATAKGNRSYQEDTHVSLVIPDKGVLFGVFDGHGGYEVSAYCARNVEGMFMRSLQAGASPLFALEETVANLAANTGYFEAGSTVSLVYIPEEGSVIFTAVLGDSPIIVGNETGVIFRGPDHNVRSNPAEADAAVARGATIWGRYARVSIHGPGLQMSRALGDRDLTFLSRTPETHVVKAPEHGFILVGSDGLFDPSHKNYAAHEEAVVRVVNHRATAQELVDNAVNTPTGDNVTAILARF